MSLHIALFGPHGKATSSGKGAVAEQPHSGEAKHMITSATPIPPSKLGMKRPLITIPVHAASPTPLPSPLSSAADTFAEPDPSVDTDDSSPPIEYERKFLVPLSALEKVRTIPGVERRMVYDTYLEPAAKGQPRMRFRFETSIDPLLGNSEDGNAVIAYSDFTVKTGADPSKRVETIYPLVTTRPNTIATINAFSSIRGVRVRSERYRWTGLEGNFQLAIYGPQHLIIEIEAPTEEDLLAFSPPKSWREVTHEPGFSNYSIASCGWPE